MRAALVLGLDGNDQIIRNPLVQRMKFLLASEAQAIQPDDALLQDYLSSNTDKFTVPARVAASLVYLGSSPSGGMVKNTLERLAAGEDHRDLGQTSLLPSGFGLSSRA